MEEKFFRRRLMFERVEQGLPCAKAVDGCATVQFTGESELIDEDRGLDFDRRAINPAVEAAFANAGLRVFAQ